MRRRGRWAAVLAAMVAASLSLLPASATAQQTGTIRGMVVTPEGGPASGIQVAIPALQVGRLTNQQGQFELTVPAGTHTLVVQSMGYAEQSQEVTVQPGAVASVRIRLVTDAVDMGALVVTALGISREERGLGYAVDNITGEDISTVPTTNVSTSLAGKAAGLQVKDLGPLGGSASVTLRGFNSISGSNQVLFIVDGIPVDNSSQTECNTGCDGNLSANYLGRSGVDYGNAIQDLNPQDIESITVLKGANAAALYGSRASNGVVLVTTKKGANAGGFSVEGTTSMTWSTPLRMPTYQNQYGGGQTPADFRWVDGLGGGYNDATDESWGPALDGTMRDQWWGTGPFLPSPYSPRSFFETGLNATTNVAVAAAQEGRHMRFSATRMDASGLVPSSGLDRTTLNLAAGLNLTDQLRLSGAGTYVKTQGEDRPVFRGYPGGMGVIFAYWQRQVDINRLEDAYWAWRNDGVNPREGHPGTRAPNWNHNFFDSPFYTVHGRSTEDTRDRVTGHLEMEYELTDWLSALGRVGTDLSSHRQFERFPVSLGDPQGALINNKIYNQETNAEALVTAEFELSEDVQLTTRGGGSVRRNDTDRSFVHVQRLNAPDVYNVSNSAGPPIINDFLAHKAVNSLYGLATASYRDMLFLDVTARNDWSSTLPDENNSYFYPSVSSSFVVSDAIDLPAFISYGKVRASWAKVGSDADPYQLRSVFLQGPFWGNTPSFTFPDQLANLNLRPEETVSIEVGTDLRFARDRASLDLTYYRTNTRDQILPVDISHTTGYAQRVLNAGEVQNQGVEAVLGFDILRDPEGLSWTATANWAKNVSKVVSLTEGLETIVLGNSRGLTVEARVGERYGALMGQTYQRDAQGRIMVGFDGRPIATEDKQLLGHFEPDWIGGIRNTFSYRNVLDLSVLLDVRQGGEVFCQTCMIGQRTGLLIETLEGRDEFGIVHEGVKPDGTPNDVSLPLPVYWRSRYVMFENGIYDASFIKLREASLAFPVPDAVMRLLPFSSARIAVVGKNLLLFTDVPHIDPELTASSGNAQGMELFLNPSPRSIGFTVSVR